MFRSVTMAKGPFPCIPYIGGVPHPVHGVDAPLSPGCPGQGFASRLVMTCMISTGGVLDVVPGLRALSVPWCSIFA